MTIDPGNGGGLAHIRDDYMTFYGAICSDRLTSTPAIGFAQIRDIRRPLSGRAVWPETPTPPLELHLS
jgi:hypothetical protein